MSWLYGWAPIGTEVIVGNDYLATWARERNPRVTVIPTPVDTERIVPKARPSGALASFVEPVIAYQRNLSLGGSGDGEQGEKTPARYVLK